MEKTKVLGKLKNIFTPFNVVVFLLLLAYSAVFIYLFVWALSYSLKTQLLVDTHDISLFTSYEFENYATAVRNFSLPKTDGSGEASILEMVGNGLLYGIGCAFFQTLCIVIVAYCTAKYSQFLLSKILHAAIIVTLALPIVGTLPSTLDMIQKLGLYDTVVGTYILKFNFNKVYYLVVYAGFRMISWDIAEAAFIDGASHFRVFVQIMLPLVSTLFGTLMIIYFIEYWNDYQGAMLFFPSHPTVSYGLIYLNTIHKGKLTAPELVAIALVVAIPILILFVVFRDKLMGNLSEGGVKA